MNEEQRRTQLRSLRSYCTTMKNIEQEIAQKDGPAWRAASLRTAWFEIIYYSCLATAVFCLCVYAVAVSQGPLSVLLKTSPLQTFAVATLLYFMVISGSVLVVFMMRDGMGRVSQHFDDAKASAATATKMALGYRQRQHKALSQMEELYKERVPVAAYGTLSKQQLCDTEIYMDEEA